MIARVRRWLAVAKAKARVVVTAWPAWAASFTTVLGVLGAELVPLLPGPWSVRAAGYVAAAVAGLAAVSAVVARVTPVLFPENQGLLAPPPNQSYTTPDGSVRNFAGPGGTTRTVIGAPLRSDAPP